MDGNNVWVHMLIWFNMHVFVYIFYIYICVWICIVRIIHINTRIYPHPFVYVPPCAYSVETGNKLMCRRLHVCKSAQTSLGPTPFGWASYLNKLERDTRIPSWIEVWKLWQNHGKTLKINSLYNRHNPKKCHYKDIHRFRTHPFHTSVASGMQLGQPDPKNGGHVGSQALHFWLSSWSYILPALGIPLNSGLPQIPHWILNTGLRLRRRNHVFSVQYSTHRIHVWYIH